ncbi:MAG: hypothetical protein NT061_05690 [Spirochaetes bacterium]|nr:hypothetical protein [Spirochaetota bacterium]
MSISEYLASDPFDELVRYGEHDALDAIGFVGTLRKHPYDAGKCLLLSGRQEKLPWIEEGQIIEFRISDVFGADEMPAIVDTTGSTRTLIRLWVRRGALALRYEPFEVGERPLGPRESEALRAKLFHLARS